MTRRKLAIGAAAFVLAVAVALGAVAATGAFSGPSAQQLAERAAARAAAAAAAERRRLLEQQARVVASAEGKLAVQLPTATGQRQPDAPAQLFTEPLPAHEVFGFVPYWEVASLSPSDFSGTSELAYYSVGINGNGTLAESGPGWTDLHNGTLTQLVSEAHAADDRILLSVSTLQTSVIGRLTRSPGAASARLATVLESLLPRYGLDGVDLDIEGRSETERAGFVSFVADLSAALRKVDPEVQIVLDTYPESAGSSSDFFDVAQLAPYVDDLFVMAYDMVDPAVASPNAPLASPSLGLSDISTLLAYTKAVPPSKLLLGIPFYGYDFTTMGDAPGAPALDPAPVAVTYQSITQLDPPTYWDPGSLTPYAHFKRGKQWHEVWFDDPVSVALKTTLASDFHLAGVGAWALGQEGGDATMVTALDGGATPTKYPPAS